MACFEGRAQLVHCSPAVGSRVTGRWLARRLTELRDLGIVTGWQITADRATGAPLWIVSRADSTDGPDTYTAT